METRIHEALNETYQNYILPFFWQHGETETVLRTYMKTIQDMGIQAVCLESRPHPDFAGPGWWHDLDIILDEAKQRNMKVWILDDSHFPTGYANGGMKKVGKELQKCSVYHLCVDLVGPARTYVDVNALLGEFSSGFPLPENHPLAKEKELLTAVLYRRKDEVSDDLTNECIPLTSSIKNGLLPLEVPDGFYRLFLIYKSYHAGLAYNDYINLLQKKSVKVLLDEVYEPHFAHYHEYFGNTIAGFFSDEPGFYNCIDSLFNFSAIVGKTDMPLPWSDELEKLLYEKNITREGLVRLWFDVSPETDSLFRYQYMNLVTDLYKKNFSMQLGQWCRAHNVEYIGHILEDNNSSSRLGPSAGHYFRAMAGQDMAGIDIVTSQVMPGRTHTHTTHASVNTYSDGEFYHYALAKLASSDAHLEPAKKGRAMCELFGNYGWSEGLEMMKWLTDFMLIRGINIFVPHAFSAKDFPDPDCPPHFYAHGHNLQAPYMKYLFTYMNRMAHILNGGRSCSQVGILYHGEAEWVGDAMFFQKPGRICMEQQVDYDVIPAEKISYPDLLPCLNDNQELILGTLHLKYLIIPYAQKLPISVLHGIAALSEHGFPVLFIDAFPSDSCEHVDATKLLSIIRKKATCLPLTAFAAFLKNQQLPMVHILSEKPYKDLRVYQYQGDDYQCMMLRNESIWQPIHEDITFSFFKPSAEYDVYHNCIYALKSSAESYMLDLEPGESRLLVSGIDTTGIRVKKVDTSLVKERYKLETPVAISVSTYEDHGSFRPVHGRSSFENLCMEPGFESFHGTIRYETTFTIDSPAKSNSGVFLVIEGANEVIQLTVNQHTLFPAIGAPYRFDVTDYIVPGKNQLIIDNTTTVFPLIKDAPSVNTGLHPLGIDGAVWFEYIN